MYGSRLGEYTSKFAKSEILLYCAILVLIFKIVSSLVYINFPQNIFFAGITKSTLEGLVNQERISLGLQALKEDPKLTEAALLKAKNMVENNYFDHTSPQGLSPWYWFLKVGYNYKYAGENLAIGFYDSAEVYNAWLESPSHKENLLNPNYKEQGIAVIDGFGPNNATVVVQLLGGQKVNATFSSNLHDSKPNITSQNKKSNTDNSDVLSKVEGAQDVIVVPSSPASDEFYYKALNYLGYNYSNLLQDIVYAFSLITSGILLYAIFFGEKTIFRTKKFLIRSAVIFLILVITALINREIVSSIIPHSIVI